MTVRFLAAAGAAAILTFAAASQADAAIVATLSFDTPSAVVANNVSIPVWLTLSLAANSDALTTDASSVVTSAIDADILAQLHNPASMFLSESFYCSGTFTNSCGPADYTFNFNYNAPAFIAPSNFDLEPGGSYNFLFGSFDPTNGAAHGGTYTFFNAAVVIEGLGDDANYHNFDLAGTCPTFTNDCAFTRTVFEAVPPGTGPGGVPEPAAWSLMILGFGGLGAQLRWRRRLVQAA